MAGTKRGEVRYNIADAKAGLSNLVREVLAGGYAPTHCQPPVAGRPPNLIHATRMTSTLRMSSMP
jgi:hypothetical protein